MDIVQKPAIALAEEALVPSDKFDPRSPVVLRKLKDLHKALEVLELEDAERFTENLANQVYLPIHYLLQKEALGELQTEYVLLILSVLFRGPWKTSLGLQKAQQFVSIVTYLTSPDPPGVNTRFLAQSSQLHSASFKCLEELFLACESSGIGAQISSSPALAHVVMILLDGIQHDEAFNTKIEALSALNALLFKIIILPDRLAMLLPGITSRLVNLIGDVYGPVHYTVKVKAIHSLANIIKGCTTDDLEADDKSVRTDSWKNASAHQINKSLVTIFQQLVTSRKVQVKWSIYELTTLLADHSLETLKPCIPAFADTLLFCASQSQDTALSKAASEKLTALSRRELFSENLESKLLELLQSLPSKFLSQDEAAPQLALRALSMGLEYSDSKSLLSSVIANVEESLNLQQNKSALLRDVETASAAQAAVSSELVKVPRLNHTDISFSQLGINLSISKGTESALARLLNKVGTVDTNNVVLQGIINRLETSNDGSLSAVRLFWMGLNILNGTTPGEEITYDLLEYSYRIVEAAGSLTGTDGDSLVALSLYAIGEISLVLGTDFQDQLMDALNPVIHLLGSDHTMVVEQAQVALQKISTSCGYASVKDLVLDNKDYIVDGIAHRLNTLDFTPATPDMLSILVTIGGGDIIPYVGDIVDPLYVILDNYHGYSKLVTGIFGVFNSIVKVVITSFPDANTLPIEPKGAKRISSFDQLLEELTAAPEVDPILAEMAEDTKLDDIEEYVKKQNEPEEKPDGDEDGSDADDIDKPMQEEVEEWNSPIPKSIYTILERIFSYSDRFLTHNSAKMRYSLLVLISTSIPLLSSSDTLFLPHVHKIWPIIVERLFDEEVYVNEAAFMCCAQLSRHAKDFMSTRITELWTRLYTSRDSTFFSRFFPEYTTENRYRAAMVSFLAIALRFTPVSPEAFDQVLDVFSAGIRKGYFDHLQESLQITHPDASWLALTDPSTVFIVPGPEFYPVEL